MTSSKRPNETDLGYQHRVADTEQEPTIPGGPPPTQYTPGLSERIIQLWFSGTPCPELTRLADAAPDLLAELKKARLDVFHHVPSPVGEIRLRAIDATIAKAEGRAQ